MLSNRLMEFATKRAWGVNAKQDSCFAEINGYHISLRSLFRRTRVYCPANGSDLASIAAMIDFVNERSDSWKAEELKYSEGFLYFDLKESIFPRSIKNLEQVLEEFCQAMSNIGIARSCCWICGAPSDRKGLVQGLLCHQHLHCPETSEEAIMEDTKVNENIPKENVEMKLAPDAARIKELAATMNPYREWMKSTLADFCKVPSVLAKAADNAPYGEANGQALDLFLKVSRELGFTAVDVDRRAAYLEWGQGDKMIAGVCHLDVVPAGEGWSLDPFILREIDGRLVARGTADDKGPMVAVLAAIKKLKDENYEAPCRIRLIVGCDEENGSSCMRHYSAVGEIPAAGFTADASFPAIYAEKGRISLFITREREKSNADCSLLNAKGGAAMNMVAPECHFQLLKAGEATETHVVKGAAAHASTPQNGVNAIQKAMAEAYELCGAGANHVLDFFHDCLKMEYDGAGLGVKFTDESGDLTLNVGICEISAETVKIGIDIRYPVTADANALVAQIDSKAKAYGLKTENVSISTPLNLGKRSAAVSGLMDVYNRMCGTNAEAIAIGGGTYARALPNILAYGMAFPGDVDVMHQVDEYIEEDKFLASAAIYSEALKVLAEQVSKN